MTHKTLEELKKEIRLQKKIVSEQRLLEKQRLKKEELEKELFKLRNRGLIRFGKKAKRVSSRFGTGIIKAGKRITPALQKQAVLIRQQQLRDDAIAKKLAKLKKPKSKILTRKTKLVSKEDIEKRILELKLQRFGVGKKRSKTTGTRRKIVKRKRTRKKPKRVKSSRRIIVRETQSLFHPLDF